ncbi:hypothetical protein DMENIID0001_031720 [Sergentomyia squamirostris]
MTTKINQKEYLKKYLSNDVGAEKKKKRKKKTITGQTVKIIDDDVDLSKMQRFESNELELLTTGEDAPQVVGVIDERPPELRAQDFKNSTKWKVFSSDNGFESSLTVQQVNKESGRIEKSHVSGSSTGRKRRDISPDLSPPRKKAGNSRRSNDLSPRKQSKSSKHSPDISPVRKRSPDLSPKRRGRRSTDKSSDLSPKRRRRRSMSSSPSRQKRSPRRREDSPDLSPPRKREYREKMYHSEKYIDHSSEKRGRFRTPDLSPRRSSHRTYSPSGSRKGSAVPSSSRRRHSRDVSPSRRRKSPELFPSRRDVSSSSRQKSSSPKRRRSQTPEPPSGREKARRTLEGKTAGLQDAKSLRFESEKIRHRDAEAFKKMSDEMSGRNASAVLRDKRTGRIRDLDREAERDRAKEQKEMEKKAVYDRWGKGVKQVEDYRKKMDEESHEMSKPLARYSDDADLDNYLKQQEREGDPMLEYIRQKEREKKKDSKAPAVPIYTGPYPENRLGLRPGYRWDGVDRSNGYEKKWFDVQNKKKAIQEEAYRYSTEDL